MTRSYQKQIWLRFSPDDVLAIRRQFARRAVIVEPCCGQYAELLHELRGYRRMGVDWKAKSFESKTLAVRQADYRQWVATDEGCAWLSSATHILLCWPPYPDPARVSGFVVNHLRPGQHLVLIGPRPYHNMSVAGDEGMWHSIFRRLTLVTELQLASCGSLLWVFEPGASPDTESRVLKGHRLWELSKTDVAYS